MEHFIRIASRAKNGIIPTTVLSTQLSNGEIAALKKIAAINTHGYAAYVLCAECGKHVSEVRTDDEGRFYGVCEQEDAGAFPVMKEALSLFRFDISTFLNSAHDGLGLSDRPQGQNGIWKIGSFTHKGTVADVFFVQQTDGQSDSAFLSQQASSATSKIIIVTVSTYTPPISVIDRVRIVSLSKLVTVPKSKITWAKGVLHDLIATDAPQTTSYHDRVLYHGQRQLISVGKSERLDHFLSYISAKDHTGTPAACDTIKKAYDATRRKNTDDTTQNYIDKQFSDLRRRCKTKEIKGIVNKIVQRTKDENGKSAVIFQPIV